MSFNHSCVQLGIVSETFPLRSLHVLILIRFRSLTLGNPKKTVMFLKITSNKKRSGHLLTNKLNISEHGGSHGHSHGLARNHSRLNDLNNTDDNDNNSSFNYKPQEKPIKKSSHGHSHDPGAMNMRGAFLHVLSDALGSIIVIISALVCSTCNKRFHRFSTLLFFRLYGRQTGSTSITWIQSFPLFSSSLFYTLCGLSSVNPL